MHQYYLSCRAYDRFCLQGTESNNYKWKITCLTWDGYIFLYFIGINPYCFASTLDWVGHLKFFVHVPCYRFVKIRKYWRLKYNSWWVVWEKSKWDSYYTGLFLVGFLRITELLKTNLFWSKYNVKVVFEVPICKLQAVNISHELQKICKLQVKDGEFNPQVAKHIWFTS